VNGFTLKIAEGLCLGTYREQLSRLWTWFPVEIILQQLNINKGNKTTTTTTTSI